MFSFKRMALSVASVHTSVITVLVFQAGVTVFLNSFKSPAFVFQGALRAIPSIIASSADAVSETFMENKSFEPATEPKKTHRKKFETFDALGNTFCLSILVPPPE